MVKMNTLQAISSLDRRVTLLDVLPTQIYVKSIQLQFTAQNSPLHNLVKFIMIYRHLSKPVITYINTKKRTKNCQKNRLLSFMACCKNGMNVNLKLGYLVEHAISQSNSEKEVSFKLKRQIRVTFCKLSQNYGFQIMVYKWSLGHKVDHIMFKDDGSAVLHVSNSTSIKPISVDYIFSALPAANLAKCISAKAYPIIHKTLGSVKSVSVAVVNLEYSGTVIPRDMGFGFLTPSYTNSVILGIVFDSCCFKDHDAASD
uniref:Amine oxidase domain-containing protein n=1 Tax=Tetranychus urticae TaxID=32264 RepID=A0A158P502_TETUR